MIHLYAIAEGLGELPAVEGIDGAQVRTRALDGLELVVSEHDGAQLDPTEALNPERDALIEKIISGADYDASVRRFGELLRQRDQVVATSLGAGQSLEPIMCHFYAVPHVGEGPFHHPRNARIILHYQNIHVRRRHLSMP